MTLQAEDISILLVDDHPVVRQGYRRVLEHQGDFRVIAEADNAAVVDRHVGVMNLAAQDVDELRVFEKQLRGRLAARDAELMLDVFHDKT